MNDETRLNQITDSRIVVVSDYEFETLCRDAYLPLNRLAFSSGDYHTWQDSLTPALDSYLSKPAGKHHKKLLEFFVSARLGGRPGIRTVLDAAGQNADYLTIIRKLYAPERSILNDIVIPDTSVRFIEYLKSGADSIPLPDNSVDLITCHHSFEHFRGAADIGFCHEIQRLLAVGGVAVIVPIFIGTSYWEVRNIPTDQRYDLAATLLIDEYSTLPGWGAGEAFARVYDFSAFARRVLSAFDRQRFELTAWAITMDGRSLPRVDVNKGTHVNYPMRALRIEHIGG